MMRIIQTSYRQANKQATVLANAEQWLLSWGKSQGRARTCCDEAGRLLAQPTLKDILVHVVSLSKIQIDCT